MAGCGLGWVSSAQREAAKAAPKPPAHGLPMPANARPTLPPLRDVIAAHGLQASKALGQNFLLDEQLLDIAQVAGDLQHGPFLRRRLPPQDLVGDAAEQ